MARRTLSPLELLTAAGWSTRHIAASPECLSTAERLVAQVDNGQALVIESLKALRHAETNKQNCANATEAAQGLEQMLHEMVNGHAVFYRVDSIHPSLGGAVAVCRAGGQVREFPVHPDVDVERLKSLKPYEYVRVHENIVCGVWCDDPYLFQSAQGEVVTFVDYAQADQHTVRVSRHGSDEHVVLLAGPLREQPLTPGAKLVLQRDQPHLAIAALPSQVGHNRFEISPDQITTRLEDLAGLEWVAERLIMDILKRIIYPEIQEEFDLDPLKGVLLLSRKPGMGKTSFVRAFVRFLREIGEEHNFDLIVYHVKPNQTKSVWHGGDAKIVREELFGVIRNRRDRPRERMLLQLVIMDEIDSFGRRPGAADVTTSSAQADGIESLLVEMDGFDQGASQQKHAAHLLVFGLSNRPDRIDDALKRPGRLGDLVLEMDALDQSGAEAICAIYAREPIIPWKLNGTIRAGVPSADIQTQVIRPAMATIFPLVVLRYYGETQRPFEVMAGEIMAGAHYRSAMNKAKQRAADRKLLGTGHPAVTYEDVVESLLEAALDVAAQMAADPHMLVRQLDVKVPVARITPVPREELAVHPYLRVPSSLV